MGQKIDRTGTQIYSKKYGLITVIDGNNGNLNLTIKFEDGTIKHHVSWQKLRQDLVSKSTHLCVSREKSIHIGEEFVIHGQLVKIIKYTSNTNVDIQLPDGNIKQGVCYHHLKKGTISIDNKYYDYITENINKHGRKMTIVDINANKHDLSVRFDDGSIKQHVRYSDFEKGFVNHKDDSNSKKHNLRLKRLNESKYNKTNGLLLQITEYYTSQNITVEYETGYIARKRLYKDFANNVIGHPFPYTVGNIVMEKLAYIQNGTGNFYCYCNKCAHKDIWNIQEIKEHQCKEVLNN